MSNYGLQQVRFGDRGYYLIWSEMEAALTHNASLSRSGRARDLENGAEAPERRGGLTSSPARGQPMDLERREVPTGVRSHISAAKVGEKIQV